MAFDQRFDQRHSGYPTVSAATRRFRSQWHVHRFQADRRWKTLPGPGPEVPAQRSLTLPSGLSTLIPKPSVWMLLSGPSTSEKSVEPKEREMHIVLHLAFGARQSAGRRCFQLLKPLRQKFQLRKRNSCSGSPRSPVCMIPCF